MMKQQHSASSLPLSKLCRFAGLAVLLKISVLALMLWNPVESWFSVKWGGQTQAYAADNDQAGAGAPPSILPEAGMNKDLPRLTPTPTDSSGKNTGQSTTGLSGDLPSTTALPAIAPKAGDGTTNATGSDITLDALTRKQEDLNRREAELRLLEEDITQKLEKMEMLENRLTVMMKEAENMNDAKLRHLVDVLSNMKAKSAAQVLETLDPRTAVKVLAGMRGRQAGEILTFVKPEIAASLTEGLARMQLPFE